MKRKFLFGLTRNITPMFFMNADNGANNGGAGNGSTGDGNNGTGDNGNGDGSGSGDGKGDGNGDGNNGSDGNKTFTQAELNKIINDRIARERKKFEGVDVEEYKRMKKEKQDKEDAEKTDLQKEKERADKLEREKQNAIDLANKRLILAEFKVLAKDNNIEYIDDAYKLADLSNVTVSEDGSIEGLKEIVEALVTDKPFLVGGISKGGTGHIDKKSNNDKGKNNGTSLGQRLAQYKASSKGVEVKNNYFK